jgi:hypothetical protein
MARRRHQKNSPVGQVLTWAVVILVIWNLIPAIPFILFFLAVIGALIGLCHLAGWLYGRWRDRD